jgi:hypothetical protein
MFSPEVIRLAGRGKILLNKNIIATLKLTGKQQEKLEAIIHEYSAKESSLEDAYIAQIRSEKDEEVINSIKFRMNTQIYELKNERIQAIYSILSKVQQNKLEEISLSPREHLSGIKK